ncbi:MAG: DUF481 domain-containing protein [Rhodospirillaceae bacterium]|nr:DUF481 domain-containing protein [Rhodospirillaceae bacterium]
MKRGRVIGRMTQLPAAVACVWMWCAPAVGQMSDTPDRQLVGEFALGGSYATGNTKRRAVDVDGQARYRAGRVEDHYKIAAELARENGRTTAKRWMLGAQSNVDIQDNLYGFGALSYEDDRFSGYAYEAEAGVGVGYRVYQSATTRLSLEVGPGYRIGALRAPVSDEKELFGRGSILFETQLSDTAKLTNDFSVAYDSDRTKIEDTLALTATLVGSLAGRASFNLRYNSNPPGLTIKKTDTVTKFALVYSF